MTQLAATLHTRKVVDWRAAFLAGLVAGTAFLLINLLVVPALMQGSFWINVRLVASIVLGHEVGHVVARHSAQLAQMVGQVANMKYGREDQLQSDTLCVR